jgi:urease accessory protein UreF
MISQLLKLAVSLPGFCQESAEPFQARAQPGNVALAFGFGCQGDQIDLSFIIHR